METREYDVDGKLETYGEKLYMGFLKCKSFGIFLKTHRKFASRVEQALVDLDLDPKRIDSLMACCLQIAKKMYEHGLYETSHQYYVNAKKFVLLTKHLSWELNLELELLESQYQRLGSSQDLVKQLEQHANACLTSDTNINPYQRMHILDLTALALADLQLFDEAQKFNMLSREVKDTLAENTLRNDLVDLLTSMHAKDYLACVNRVIYLSSSHKKTDAQPTVFRVSTKDALIARSLFRMHRILVDCFRLLNPVKYFKMAVESIRICKRIHYEVLETVSKNIDQVIVDLWEDELCLALSTKDMNSIKDTIKSLEEPLLLYSDESEMDSLELDVFRVRMLTGESLMFLGKYKDALNMFQLCERNIMIITGEQNLPYASVYKNNNAQEEEPANVTIALREFEVHYRIGMCFYYIMHIREAYRSLQIAIQVSEKFAIISEKHTELLVSCFLTLSQLGQYIPATKNIIRQSLGYALSANTLLIGNSPKKSIFQPTKTTTIYNPEIQSQTPIARACYRAGNLKLALLYMKKQGILDELRGDVDLDCLTNSAIRSTIELQKEICDKEQAFDFV